MRKVNVTQSDSEHGEKQVRILAVRFTWDHSYSTLLGPIEQICEITISKDIDQLECQIWCEFRLRCLSSSSTTEMNFTLGMCCRQLNHSTKKQFISKSCVTEIQCFPTLETRSFSGSASILKAKTPAPTCSGDHC